MSKKRNTYMTGKVKRIMDKGYGFIETEEADKDLFFHAGALVDANFDELQEGDAVTFDMEETPKGLNAVNVARA